MEHWLPLFSPSTATLFDYLPNNSLVALDHLSRESRDERLAMIEDAYEARSQEWRSFVDAVDLLLGEMQ